VREFDAPDMQAAAIEVRTSDQGIGEGLIAREKPEHRDRQKKISKCAFGSHEMMIPKLARDPSALKA
jgi:hypothetical protein